MRIAVLNLARMGDILLSGPLLVDVRRRWPGAELHLVVPAPFVPVGEGLDVDAVHGLDSDGLAKAAVSVDSPVDLYRLFRRELAGLLALAPDKVINLGYDNVSAVLAHLLGGEPIAGAALDRHGYRRMHGAWSRLVKASHLARGQNPFHLADLHLRVIGDERRTPAALHFAVDDTARKQARTLLSETVANETTSGPLVVFQVGASHPSKRWPARGFGRVAARLEQDHGARCVFVGVASEAEAIQEAMREAGPGAVALAGRTKIPELAAVLEAAELVISNDTGTMHLAVAVGTRVIALTFGNALAQETGPYGEGHAVLEPVIGCYPCDFHVKCPHYNCHKTLDPGVVARIAAGMLRDDRLDGLELGGASVTLSRTGFDASGFWRKTLVAGAAARPAEELRDRYRAALLETLADSAVSPDAELSSAAQERLTTDPLGGVVLDGRSAAMELLEGLEDARQGDLSALAARVDEAQDAVLNQHLHRSELHLLLALFRFELEAAGEQEGVDVVARSARAFHALARRMAGVLGQSGAGPGETTVGSAPDAAAAGRKMRGDRTRKSHTPSRQPIIVPEADAETRPRDDAFARFQRPRMRGERHTVILFESDYYLQTELGNSLRQLGHRVIPIRYGDVGDVIERLLLASLDADLLMTVNHLGFDEQGELASLLERIRLPYVSWYVDRPAYILLDHNAAPGEMDHVFTWERETVAELHDYGFERVSYLPLATDRTLFPAGRARYDGSGPCWVANSMVEPVREWTLRAEARSSHEPLLRFMEESLLDERRDPAEVMDDARIQFPVMTKDWTRRRRIQMTNLAALRATGADRHRVARALQADELMVIGDPAWDRCVPGVKRRDPVDYGAELANLYAGSLQLNSTSFQMPTAVNQRVFDVPASGGVLLTDDQADLYDLFDADTECFTYRTPEEATEKVRWIRQHPAQAAATADRARERIERDHSYTKRITTILDRVRAGMRPAAVVRRA